MMNLDFNVYQSLIKGKPVLFNTLVDTHRWSGCMFDISLRIRVAAVSKFAPFRLIKSISETLQANSTLLIDLISSIHLSSFLHLHSSSPSSSPLPPSIGSTVESESVTESVLESVTESVSERNHRNYSQDVSSNSSNSSNSTPNEWCTAPEASGGSEGHN